MATYGAIQIQVTINNKSLTFVDVSYKTGKV